MTAYEFPLKSGALPSDHGYALLSALSVKLPFLHGRHDVQIAPVRGTRINEGKDLKIDQGSSLHIRGISHEEALKVADVGWIAVNGSVIYVGPDFYCRRILPQPILVSRLVLLRDAIEQEAFTKALVEKLPEGVVYQVGKYHACRIKDKKWIGYVVRLAGLTEEDSLRIQEQGLGNARSMGCGVFYNPGSGRN